VGRPDLRTCRMYGLRAAAPGVPGPPPALPGCPSIPDKGNRALIWATRTRAYKRPLILAQTQARYKTTALMCPKNILSVLNIRYCLYKGCPWPLFESCGLHRTCLGGDSHQASFHFIEQPMLGICSRGPRPVVATAFMASNRSRRASGGAASLRLASRRPRYWRPRPAS